MGFSRQEYWSGVPLPSLSDHLEHNKRGGRGPRNGIYFFGAEDKKLGLLGFPGGSDDTESVCHNGDLGLIPGLGRSPGEGKGYPLQYSGLDNSMGLQRVGND